MKPNLSLLDLEMNGQGTLTIHYHALAIPHSSIFAVTYYTSDTSPTSVLEASLHISHEPTHYIAIHSILMDTLHYSCSIIPTETHEFTLLQSLVKNNAIKKLLILINPTSGDKKGMDLFHDTIGPIFKIANITTTVIVTRFKNDAFQKVNSLRFGDVDGIVCVSGDGIIHEVVNGLILRKDWEKMRQIPIGLIPAGSASALNLNLGNSHVLSATLTILKGTIQPMDVFSFAQGKKITFSHLSLNWGFLADADIESEGLRWIGSTRFTLYALYLLAIMKSYEGEFYYLCESDKKPSIQPFTEYHGPPLKYYHADPTQWHSEKLNVNSLAITNLPWIASGLSGSPDAKLNDGFLYLSWTSNLSRWNAIKLLLNGRLFDSPAEYRKDIVAFYLKPGICTKTGTRGILDLSGELMPYKPVKIEVHPSLLSVFVPQK